MSVARVLLGLLDMTLVEQSRSHQGVVARRVRRRGGNRVPGRLPPLPRPEVDVQARPAVKGQSVEESLHGVQDALKEAKRKDHLKCQT